MLQLNPVLPSDVIRKQKKWRIFLMSYCHNLKKNITPLETWILVI